jgi:signal peptide peptidase SppA
MRAAVEAVKAGTFQPYVKKADPIYDEDAPARPPYRVVSGIAVIPVVGPIMKARSKFGGTSSVDFRVALRKAQNDESVDSILLQIDSPGGAVAGTFEAAKDVARANAVKPVYAHVEDLGCSGAYLLASQARRITADTTSFIGSIGVVTSLVDESAALAKAGIKVITVSTGGMKGAGADGKVTDEMIAETQARIDAIGEHFISAVSSGRKMTIASVRKLADGRVHIAQEAKQLGLIDEVASLDAVVERIYRASAGTPVIDPPQECPADEDAPESSQTQPADATKEIYVLARTAELDGTHRSFTREPARNA